MSDLKILYASMHPEQFEVKGKPGSIDIQKLFCFYMGDADLGGKAQKRYQAIKTAVKREAK